MARQNAYTSCICWGLAKYELHMKESDGHLRCSFALWRLMGCLGRVSVRVCVHVSPGICLVSQQRLLKLLVEGEV